MAEANLKIGLLNVMTHFLEQHDRPNTPTEKELEIFTDILHHFNGKMHVRYLPTLDLDQPLNWIREHPERFHVFEDDDGHAVMVGVVSRGVRVCTDYNTGHRMPGCHRSGCQAFHVCRDHVGGWCRAGAGCRRQHLFTDDHNQRLMQWFRLDGFNCDELLRILAMSTPQVCSDYNNKGCRLMDRCTRIHVCRNYVARMCTIADCDRAHDYQSAHSQRLLCMYRLSALSADYIRQHLLFYRVNPRHTRVQGRAGGLLARAAAFRAHDEDDDDDDDQTLDELPVLPRVPQRFDVAPVKLLDDDSGDESPPPGVVEDRPIKESARTKTVPSANSARPLSSAAAVAGSREKSVLSLLAAMPQSSTKKESRPSTNVIKLQSRRLIRHSSTEQRESKKTADVHIHQTAAEKIYICEKNVQGECPLQSKCACHHYPQPFLWQVNAFDKWVTLDEVNNIIESSFCDPSTGEVFIKLPDIADGAFETEMYGNIVFAGMTMYISLLDMYLTIRRLTTKSYVCTEVDSCYISTVASVDDTRRGSKTKWVWYYESPDGSWNKYKDQEQLEENYISGRKECQFKMNGVTLIVRQSELVQVNSRTGQRSNIRRRPEFSGTDHEKGC